MNSNTIRVIFSLLVVQLNVIRSMNWKCNTKLSIVVKHSKLRGRFSQSSMMCSQRRSRHFSLLFFSKSRAQCQEPTTEVNMCKEQKGFNDNALFPIWILELCPSQVSSIDFSCIHFSTASNNCALNPNWDPLLDPPLPPPLFTHMIQETSQWLVKMVVKGRACF